MLKSEVKVMSHVVEHVLIIVTIIQDIMTDDMEQKYKIFFHTIYQEKVSHLESIYINDRSN
jgi:hypothetical protein